MASENVETNSTYVKCNINYLVSRRALISDDKRVALCGCGNKVLVFGLKTGKLLRKLQSHESKIVDFHFRKRNPFQVISASEDGSIILWDYTDGTIIKKLALKYSICSMLPHPTQEDLILVTKQTLHDTPKGKKSGKKHTTLLQVNLNITRKKKKGTLLGETICTSSSKSKLTAVSSNGNYIASLKGKKLLIYSVAEKKTSRYSYGDQAFTCLAFHPTKLLIATGNSQGKIILWQDFLNESPPVTTELHWHAHAVGDLAFTHDGMYLISGGVEAVLVTWQLETLSRDFTPRLGSPIEHLTVSNDDMLIAVTLNNNVVKIISAVDKNLTCTLQGLSKGSTCVKEMIYDPRTECLVLPGLPSGHLQFYQPLQDSVLLMVDVVGCNYLSGLDNESSFHTEIEHFALSYDGKWLATVEKGSYKVIPDEIKLKFWMFDVKSQRYQLNTIADPPHEDSIVDLRIRPRPEKSDFTQLAVTTGSSGKFKIWALAESSNQENANNKMMTWSCHAVCYYGNDPCGQSAFSEDGSLLAVVYDKTITIWNAELGSLETCLYSPVQNESVSDVIFGCGPSAAYMLAKTSHYLICWNLLTCSVWWSLEGRVSCLAADPSTGLFSVFAEFRKMYFFDASSPKPALVLGRLPSDEKPLCALFTGKDGVGLSNSVSNLTYGELYYFTDQKNIYRVCDAVGQDNEKEESSGGQDLQSEFDSIFSSIIGMPSDPKTPQQSSNVPAGVPTSRVIKTILSTPSHVLPPVSSLCAAFFKSVSLNTSLDTSNNEDQEEKYPEDCEHQGNSSSDEEECEDIKRNNSKEEIEQPNRNVTIAAKPSNFQQTMSFDWLSTFVQNNYRK